MFGGSGAIGSVELLTSYTGEQKSPLVAKLPSDINFEVQH